MERKEFFPKEHFVWMQPKAYESAKEIVPLICELIHPKSVIDLGCATGDWLKVFKEYGATEILGVDADWVSMDLLEIQPEEFMTHDIREPLHLEKRFDLATTFEAFHHVPMENAPGVIDALCKIAPMVLLSSAIPYQGQKTQHVNDQWPEYWAELFSNNGFVAIDCVRDKVWGNPKVQPYYAQNTILYVREDCLEHNEALKKAYEQTNKRLLSRVHPSTYMHTVYTVDRWISLIGILKILPGVFMRALKKKLKILTWYDNKQF